jgi:hypothetical protein
MTRLRRVLRDPKLLIAVAAIAVAAWVMRSGHGGGGANVEGVDASTMARGSRLDDLDRTHQETSFSLLSGFVYSPEGFEPTILGKAGANRPRIPDEVMQLNGTDVKIDGFMLPLDFNGVGVGLFILNANQDRCGLGAPTVINELIVVTMTQHRRTVLTHMPIRVFGRFQVGEERRDGRLASLYRMDAEAIGPPGG